MPALRDAHQLARMFAIFPVVHREKCPACPHGVKEATRDPAQIQKWWKKGLLNVGIACGEPSGILVVDCDTNQAAVDFAAEFPAAGKTVMAKTPRGAHFYFRYPGPAYRNRVKVREHVDIRSDGGYVVAPPSIHPCGEPYTWRRAPWEVQPAPLPDGVRKLLDGGRSPGIPTMIGSPALYAAAAIRNAASRVREAHEGKRNHTLNREAFALAQLAAAGYLAPMEIRDVMREAAREAGLDDFEINNTLDSALRPASPTLVVPLSAPPPKEAPFSNARKDPPSSPAAKEPPSSPAAKEPPWKALLRSR
jgi:hypothetical protein